MTEKAQIYENRELIMSINAWYIFILSMLPLTELRVTIPLAITQGMTPWLAFLLAVAGNLVPVMPILLLLTPLERGLSRFPRAGFLLQKFLKKTRAKGKQVKKYGAFGLALFVAIPLPGTGAWTGAALAWLFGIPYRIAFLAIGVGVVIAGFLVTIASMGLVKVALYYGLEYLLAMLIFFGLLLLWRRKNK